MVRSNWNAAMKRNLVHKLLLILAPLAVLTSQGAGQNVRVAAGRTQKQVSAQPPSSLPIPRTWTPPDAKEIPSGPYGEAILLGMRIFTQTPQYASAYVGDQLS